MLQLIFAQLTHGAHIDTQTSNKTPAESTPMLWPTLAYSQYIRLFTATGFRLNVFDIVVSFFQLTALYAKSRYRKCQVNVTPTAV